MTFDLKPITRDAIPRALETAQRYRFLNEPMETESICRDVLAIDPANQPALILLILALTDDFATRVARVAEARQHAATLTSPYDRSYYQGVVEERWAKATLRIGEAPAAAYGFLIAAMQHFETACRIAPPGNEDASLRWNSCARIIQRHNLTPAHDAADSSFDDDVPPR